MQGAHRWGAAWEMDSAPDPPVDVRIVGQEGSEACPSQGPPPLN